LTGTSGEDFASILRSLGYRMEQRPKPPEPAADAQPQGEPETAPAADTAPAAQSTAASVGIAPLTEPEGGASADAELERSAPFNEDAPAGAEIEPGTPSLEPSLVPAADAPEGAGSASGLPVFDGAKPEDASTITEEMIEVWRPGRPEHRRGDRSRRRGPRRRERAEEPREPAPRAASATQSPQPQTIGEKAGSPPGPRQRRAERERARSPSAQPRREPKERREREPKERRERAPDPNSPFAKLAALKAQLEADSKERP
jgi:ATP-dependent RNA helicase SUPV3L1/SUV3